MHVPPTWHEHIINACVSMKQGANQSLWLVDDGHEVLGTSVSTGQANLRARGSKGDLKEQLSSLLHLVGLLQPDLYTHHFVELFLEQVEEYPPDDYRAQSRFETARNVELVACRMEPAGPCR